MISALLAALAAATAAPTVRGVIVEEHVEMAQVIFHSRVVIRVRTAPATAIPPATTWREKKGPSCVPMTDILGAAVIAPNSVDLVLRGGQRMRARFGACPALDYYSGFYIVPPSDAQICADRDVVRDRAGGECAIDRFRALSPR